MGGGVIVFFFLFYSLGGGFSFEERCWEGSCDWIHGGFFVTCW